MSLLRIPEAFVDVELVELGAVENTFQGQRVVDALLDAQNALHGIQIESAA